MSINEEMAILVTITHPHEKIYTSLFKGGLTRLQWTRYRYKLHAEQRERNNIMNSYSGGKHCSSSALREAGILQEKSKPVGDVWSVLLQAALIRHGAAQQGPCNSPASFILYSFPTTTLNKQPTLVYSFPTGLHFADFTSLLGNCSLSQHIPVTVFENFHLPGLPHTPCSHLLTDSCSCYCIASLALSWPTTFPFSHLQCHQFLTPSARVTGEWLQPKVPLLPAPLWPVTGNAACTQGAALQR